MFSIFLTTPFNKIPNFLSNCFRHTQTCFESHCYVLESDHCLPFVQQVFTLRLMRYMSTLSMHKQTKWTVESTRPMAQKTKLILQFTPGASANTAPQALPRLTGNGRPVEALLAETEKGHKGQGVVEGSLLIKIYVLIFLCQQPLPAVG